MERIPTWLVVVAAALRSKDGHWLMHRRPRDKHHGGLWEFPGGKVEEGESPRSALVRELAEELGIAVDEEALASAGFAVEAESSAGRRIVILLYTCTRWRGEPRALEGEAVEWFSVPDILELAKPPLDQDLARSLFESGAS